MKTRVTAIVLAAGYSSRMGKFKPLLSLGETTVLERVITLFRDAGISDIRVVVGYRSEELLPLLGKMGVPYIVNQNFRAGMFSSVVAGVKSLEESVDVFFVLPVDIPLIRPWTLHLLLQAYQGGKGKIIHPCFQGKRGHPPLVSACLADQITVWRGRDGLKGALAQLEADAIQIEVPDENILLGMNTLDDYHQLQAKWRRYDIPTSRECEVLLNTTSSMEKWLYDHSHLVARLALLMGRALSDAGCSLDLDLIFAGALLHDIAKGTSQHAVAGGRILREMGYPRVADIAASHVDIVIHEGEEINESEVVYLSDKMVLGDQYVTDFRPRFEAKLREFSHAPDIQTNINRRLENALTIQRRVERRLNRPLEAILSQVVFKAAEAY
jgi:putative nucleotidyltransferase with HDIG domain